MPARLVALCIDANDPRLLARFWAEALRWDVGDDRGDEVALVPTDGTSFTIVFRRAAEPNRIAQHRVHLDLTTSSLDDQRGSVERLLALGARHLDVGQGPDADHVVLADPEGYAFCLIEPWNRFLSTCGRLGALSCDGSRSVGSFWSAALGWPLVWDEGEETAIRAPDGTGPFVTWGGPPDNPRTDRLRLVVEGDVDELVALGATPAGDGVLRDPDGNALRVLP